jgi:methyl-accepting chemotaxis protein
MLTSLRRRSGRADPQANGPLSAPAGRISDEAMQELTRKAAGLGREAAELNGLVEDLAAGSAGKAAAMKALALDIDGVVEANRSIEAATRVGNEHVSEARAAVARVGEGVEGVVRTLREVASAAQDISQIALQTRLVAFNASVEAKRAGEAGRGFAVVAEAVKDLSAKVEQSSKLIMNTVAQLDRRVAELAGDISAGPTKARPSVFQRAMHQAEASVAQIAEAAAQNLAACAGAARQMRTMSADVTLMARSLGNARETTTRFLSVAESLVELTAESGYETVDTPYIGAVLEAAARISALFTEAVRSGAIAAADLFDENYAPVAGTDPQQYTTRFVAFTDQVLPQIQEPLLQLSSQVVFCAAVDRNGFLPTHNLKFSRPQGADPVWNAANSRNRRIFDDRTGLAASRNRRRFLLQTYRRDMGGGEFALMKDLSAPIVVDGRHWGGLRLAYTF